MTEAIRQLIDGRPVFWFRRDLRLEDNAGLHSALSKHKDVVPVFIFDTAILSKLDDKADRRVDFIHQSLQRMQSDLLNAGSSMVVVQGDPIAIWSQVTPSIVYTNNDYEPYARKRDDKVREILAGKGIPFVSVKDQVIFEKDEVVKDDGSPYTIFTPYSKKWKSKLDDYSARSFASEKLMTQFARTASMAIPSLSALGFRNPGATSPPRLTQQKILHAYHEQRDIPSLPGTSRLSVHLRFGTVSIRRLVQIARKLERETWLNELIWREFYHMILWHFPHVEKAFKPSYDRIVWRNDPEEFLRWCNGTTGYPIVDAGMRELNTTGFMHNRVRMITASFLTKHLLIDWRWGEAWFAKRLLDFDLAANNGGWQWASSSGCDAAPYFRVFNPALQTDKFDPEKKYIRQWVPEFESSSYAKPIVDHAMARERVLRTYKEALGNEMPETR